MIDNVQSGIGYRINNNQNDSVSQLAFTFCKHHQHMRSVPEFRNRLHHVVHESPSCLGLCLDAQKHGSMGFNFVLQPREVIVAHDDMFEFVFQIVLTFHFGIGQGLDGFFRLFIVVGNGKAQKKRWNDGRDEDGEDHRSVQILVDQSFVHGKDGNDKGEFPFRRHAKSRN